MIGIFNFDEIMLFFKHRNVSGYCKIQITSSYFQLITQLFWKIDLKSYTNVTEEDAYLPFD